MLILPMQGHVGGMGLCRFVSFWFESLLHQLHLLVSDLFFTGYKLLAGRRDGWTAAWNSETPNIYFLLYSEFSCGFTWSFPWDMLSLEDVPGFFDYSAGILYLSGQLQLIAQVCGLILLEIDLIWTIYSFHDQYEMNLYVMDINAWNCLRYSLLPST